MESKLEKIGINDIEKMIDLADDVLRQLECNLFLYDINDGIALEEKYNNDYEKILERSMKLRENDEYNEKLILVMQIIRENKSLNELLCEKAIVNVEKIKDLHQCALGIFRHGSIQDTVVNRTNYVADDTVEDKYLLELLGVRIRDRQIVLAAQRENCKEDGCEDVLMNDE